MSLLVTSALAVVVEEFPLPDTSACIGPAEWQAMLAEGERNIARLRAEGKLAPPDRTLDVPLQWPLLPSPSFPDSSCPDQLLDYECGDRYYLVVPTNGADNGGFERPQGTDACRIRFLGDRP
jgi:hypothetical protein